MHLDNERFRDGVATSVQRSSAVQCLGDDPLALLRRWWDSATAIEQITNLPEAQAGQCERNARSRQQ